MIAESYSEGTDVTLSNSYTITMSKDLSRVRVDEMFTLHEKERH